MITHHPAVLAQTALTLDHVTKGRAILGLGSGEQLNVTPYGMDWDKPVGHLDEAHRRDPAALGAPRAPSTSRAQFYNAQGRGARALALHARAARRSGSPPTSRGCSGSPAARATAGCRRRCCPSEYGDALATIRERSVDAGRPEDAVTPGMLAYVIVGPDEEAVERIKRAPARPAALRPAAVRRLRASSGSSRRSAAAGSGFHDFLPTRVSREEALRIAEAIPPADARLLRVLRHARPGRRASSRSSTRRASGIRSSGTSPRSATRRWPGSRSRR